MPYIPLICLDEDEFINCVSIGLLIVFHHINVLVVVMCYVKH